MFQSKVNNIRKQQLASLAVIGNITNGSYDVITFLFYKSINKNQRTNKRTQLIKEEIKKPLQLQIHHLLQQNINKN